MRTDELEPEPPPRTGFHGSRYWWMTAALSVFSSSSFVVTVLAPGPEALLPVRLFVLGLFIVGLLTGVISAIMLMMSGFFVAGTARIAGRKIADDDLGYFYLVCYAVPVIVVVWSIFRGLMVY